MLPNAAPAAAPLRISFSNQAPIPTRLTMNRCYSLFCDPYKTIYFHHLFSFCFRLSANYSENTLFSHASVSLSFPCLYGPWMLAKAPLLSTSMFFSSIASQLTNDQWAMMTTPSTIPVWSIFYVGWAFSHHPFYSDTIAFFFFLPLNTDFHHFSL